MASDLTLRYASFPTPLGTLWVVRSGEGVLATTTGDPDEMLDELGTILGTSARLDAGALAGAGRELRDYFARRLRRFRTPVDLRLVSSPFARADAVALKQDAAAVVARYFPDAPALYAQQNWRLPASRIIQS